MSEMKDCPNCGMEEVPLFSNSDCSACRAEAHGENRIAAHREAIVLLRQALQVVIDYAEIHEDPSCERDDCTCVVPPMIDGAMKKTEAFIKERKP